MIKRFLEEEFCQRTIFVIDQRMENLQLMPKGYKNDLSQRLVFDRRNVCIFQRLLTKYNPTKPLARMFLDKLKTFGNT